VTTNAAELHRKDGVPKVKQSPSKAVLDENGLADGSQVITQRSTWINNMGVCNG